MKIVKPASVEEVNLNVLMYGLTGAGKTQFLGTAEECEATKPILIIDVDGGMVTLSGTGIDVVRPKTLEQVQEVYDFLRHDNTQYQSVGVDSLTAIHKMAKAELQGDEEAAQYSDLANIHQSTQRDWGRASEYVENLMKAFQELAYLKKRSRRIAVFFTCLEKRDDRRNIIGPDLPGQLMQKVGAYVDVLTRLSIQKGTLKGEEVEARHLLLEEFTDDVGDEEFRFLAKNRAGRLGKKMWNPTATKLNRKWLKGTEAK